MGRKVSKSGQINKAQSLIDCAREKQYGLCDTIEALKAFVNDKTLLGDAYKNAKGYVQSVLLPINKALCMALDDEIAANKQVINCCNTYLVGVDLIDENTISNEISRLNNRINYWQGNSWDYTSFMKQRLISNYYQQIYTLKDQLQKLDSYDNATSGLHEKAISRMNTITQKINSIFSKPLFVNGRYDYSGVDMKWAFPLSLKWDMMGYSTKLKFKQNFQAEFGFDGETVDIMWDVYKALQKKYPDASQLEIDWRFTRLLGGLKYDDGTYGKIKWDDVAGIAIDQYHDYRIDEIQMTAEEYFVKFLGIREDDYQMLRYKVRIQHEIVGDCENYRLPNSLSELEEEIRRHPEKEEIIRENLKKWKNTYTEITGIRFKDDNEFLAVWNRQYDNFIGKGDFAHQQITTSAIFASRLKKDGALSNVGVWGDNERVVEKAGWLGDATLGDTPSFGPEDYISDLDAKNISTYMEENDISYFIAASQYYSDLNAGQSRATIFLKSTPLKEVKGKIYADLVYPKVRAQIRSATHAYDINQVKRLEKLIQDDEDIMEMLKTTAPDTYRFIKNLEAQNSTMEAVQ